MVILFNPPTPMGSDINGFTLKGIGMIEPHLTGDLKQYTETVAEALVENFGFLREVSPDEAKKIIENKGKALKCDFPNCDFTTDVAIALEGHKRSHSKESSEPVIAPDLVPVAGARPIISNPTADERVRRENTGVIQNGADADGVEWYGEGLQQESQVEIRRPGAPGVFGA